MPRKTNDGPVIQMEKETITKMIEIYCRKKHHRQALCDDCHNLKNYALTRLSYCPFGEKKSACSNCKIHCYRPEYRRKIKTVMRYAGMWMLLYHPVFSIKHLLKR
ncbi:nitrous oxide-stimulated promoter family protein [Terrilactibacillus sp. BCM23-1]|uniref:Nitrous oxide-stimulated promoter family protein n=1 Tax=Terrilactibacillus tamarindi TaxID=2599694 RepID=A0A6N8CMT2_9BACI|nr:nitrous oxide-stimulated promoter family protein [Terrilactibacillus tamarindi]MTT31389.1 nitrous oxide-stimulated promoter family protein [Terrilactibacillus tamarindi]